MTSVGSNQESRKRRTRASLIDAAVAVFGRRGYQAATIDEICAAAGYSKGAYYFHFPSKESVFRELLRLWADEQSARLRDSSRTPARQAALLDMLDRFLDYAGRDRAWPPLVLEFWAQARRDPDTGKALQDAYGAWQRLLADAFRRAEREAAEGGLTGAADPDVAARAVLAAHDGLIVEAGLDPDSAASVRHTLGALLRSLATGQPLPPVERPDVSGPERRELPGASAA